MTAHSSLPLSSFVFHSHLIHRLDRSLIVLTSAATEVVRVLPALVRQSNWVNSYHGSCCQVVQMSFIPLESMNLMSNSSPAPSLRLSLLAYLVYQTCHHHVIASLLPPHRTLDHTFASRLHSRFLPQPIGRIHLFLSIVKRRQCEP